MKFRKTENNKWLKEFSTSVASAKNNTKSAKKTSKFDAKFAIRRNLEVNNENFEEKALSQIGKGGAAGAPVAKSLLQQYMKERLLKKI